jgi:hypothetical protein
MDMAKKGHAIQGESSIDESQILERVARIIETCKSRADAHINSAITMMYWEVGHYINSAVLDNGRAEYGKKILPPLAAKLMVKYILSSY